MTLYRQLLIFVITLLFILFAGMWGEKLKSTRSFLLNQLESHAQDTATSLGLSLSTFLGEMDTPAMETMINAVFDRGYYRCIELTDLSNTVVVTRNLDVKVEGVPQWFIRLAPLSAPKAESLIMDNWKQAGTITVESHPGFAYATLWDTVRSTTLWFTAAIFGTALIGGLGLHYLLRPLKKVEEQALGLCERQYNLQKKIPRTRELGRVVVAMNTMTAKVREMFTEQADAAEALFQQTYLDPLTGIGNRRFMEGQVLSKATDKKPPVQGAFLIIHLINLQQVNNTMGYEAGDTLLRELAQVIRSTCETHSGSAARLGGSDFAVFLPNGDKDLAETILESILEKGRVITTSLDRQENLIAGGGILYQANIEFSNLLKGADETLRTAIHSGATGGILREEIPGKIGREKGKTEWKKLLERTLAKGDLHLFYQKTVNARCLEEPVHCEVLTRIVDENNTIFPAGLFIPIAERFNLISKLDRIVINKLLALPPDLFPPGRIALNISPTSLAEPEFYNWLLETLNAHPEDGPKLNFEFAEIRAVRHRDLLRQFMEDIEVMGHYVGIDHFGQSLIHFGYLQSLMPNYIKIDRAITRKLNQENRDNVFFISSICNAAHSLDIRVIVEGIENKEQLEALNSIAVDAVQGYYIQHPEPIQQAEA